MSLFVLWCSPSASSSAPDGGTGQRRWGGRAALARSKEEHRTKLKPQKRCGDAPILSFSRSLAGTQGPFTVQTLHFLILTSDVYKTGLLALCWCKLFVRASSCNNCSWFLYHLSFLRSLFPPFFLLSLTDLFILPPPPSLCPCLLPLPLFTSSDTAQRRQAAKAVATATHHGLWFLLRGGGKCILCLWRGGEGGIRQSNINFCRAHPPRFMLTQSLDENCWFTACY